MMLLPSNFLKAWRTWFNLETLTYSSTRTPSNQEVLPRLSRDFLRLLNWLMQLSISTSMTKSNKKVLEKSSALSDKLNSSPTLSSSSLKSELIRRTLLHLRMTLLEISSDQLSRELLFFSEDFKLLQTKIHLFYKRKKIEFIDEFFVHAYLFIHPFFFRIQINHFFNSSWVGKFLWYLFVWWIKSKSTLIFQLVSLFIPKSLRFEKEIRRNQSKDKFL